MYLLRDLKKEIKIGSDRVECPVIGCENHVKRQSVSFKREQEFFCPDHGIYISPSTFEYKDEKENLLWHEAADAEYLAEIKRVKRESRMARERSEDALTWNVFRYLEKHQLISQTMERFTGEFLEKPEVIYGSYSSIDQGVSSLLKEARDRFGETAGMEPDMIFHSKQY